MTIPPNNGYNDMEAYGSPSATLNKIKRLVLWRIGILESMSNSGTPIMDDKDAVEQDCIAKELEFLHTLLIEY